MDSLNGCFYTFREPFYKSSPRLTSNSESRIDKETFAAIQYCCINWYSMKYLLQYDKSNEPELDFNRAKSNSTFNYNFDLLHLLDTEFTRYSPVLKISSYSTSLKSNFPYSLLFQYSLLLHENLRDSNDGQSCYKEQKEENKKSKDH